MDGKGAYTWPDGRKYEGYYEVGKKSGQGVFCWPDGREYNGSWKDGKQDGIGKFKGKDGVIKIGQWENGKRVKWIQVVNPSHKSSVVNSGSKSDEQNVT